MSLLSIKNLSVTVDGELILRELSLDIHPGEIHAIMGPNGAGKSTLCRVLLGDQAYQVVGGSITFRGEDLLEKEADERALLGLFTSFQHPIEIPGISYLQFLHASFNAKLEANGGDFLSLNEFRERLLPLLQKVGLSEAHLDRDLHLGFSGGEKKKSEMLQLLLFAPHLALLDETDSGLDIDALRTIAATVREGIGQQGSLLVITHYPRLLEDLRPTHVHIMVAGRVVKSGDYTLATQTFEKGYALHG